MWETDINRTMNSHKGEETMAKVGIVMGSDSDMPVMSKAADILNNWELSLR